MAAINENIYKEYHNKSETEESYNKYDSNSGHHIQFGDDSSQGIGHTFSGESRQNENGILKICQILIDRLNEYEGNNWGNLRDNSDESSEIDCIAYQGQEELKIQVTRSESNQNYWRDLSKFGFAKHAYKTRCELLDTLKSSIHEKSQKYPAETKKDLLLVLDANETASHALEKIVNDFRLNYGKWASEQGFLSIWVVGPNSKLTHKLNT
jgi:hypothetical protein